MGKGFIINSFYGIKIMYKTKPSMFFVHILFTFIHGISWALQVILMQKFFDTAEQFAANKIGIDLTLISLLGMVLSYALCQLMNGVDNCHARIFSLNVSKTTNRLIFENIDKLDILDFEDTKRLDSINKAINGSQNVIWVSLTLLDSIFFYSTYFIFMGWFLFTLKPVLGVSILIVFIPCIISKIIQTKTFEDLENKIAPIRRECDYYEGCAKDIKETRLLGATYFFTNLYSTAIKKLNRYVFFAQVRKQTINFVLDILTTIGYGIIIYLLFIFVMKKEISVGAFAAVLTSLYRLFDFMSEVISERIGWAYENLSTVQNFYEFINEKKETKQFLEKPLDFKIELKNLNFIYPLAHKNALTNINLSINSGETLAIVGENGSGKTTLCRLIMGLYKPSKGEVLFGDVPASNICYDNTSAIFQKFCRYKMTLRDNIIVSQLEKTVSDLTVLNVCNKSGVLLKDYKDGIHTIIGRDFDGIEISGGQWQRVAIARGLFRNSDLIILDEPTAAIDPIEETRLYNDFSNICDTKTAIIVTHRLGSAKIADRIIVMKDGEIVQEGNHKQLINIDGEYKKMFEAQSKWYTK